MLEGCAEISVLTRFESILAGLLGFEACITNVRSAHKFEYLLYSCIITTRSYSKVKYEKYLMDIASKIIIHSSRIGMCENRGM